MKTMFRCHVLAAKISQLPPLALGQMEAHGLPWEAYGSLSAPEGSSLTHSLAV